MRGNTLTVSTSLVVEECYKCGVPFALPSDLQDKLLANHDRSFYCPNGHSQHYVGKTEAQKERERRREVEAQLTHAQEATHRERTRADSLERSRRAVKGQLTKTKKRIAKGVCPCCNRQFENLHRHMTTQHPDFVNPAGEEEA